MYMYNVRYMYGTSVDFNSNPSNHSPLRVVALSNAGRGRVLIAN